MARQNVILDILHEEEMKYHTQDEIGRLMNQLPVTYAGKARTYPLGETNGRSMLYVMEMSDSLENSHLKPALKVQSPPHKSVPLPHCSQLRAVSDPQFTASGPGSENDKKLFHFIYRVSN